MSFSMVHIGSSRIPFGSGLAPARSLPIQRDWFLNKLPLRSSMVYFVNPTPFRHMSDFFADGTLVNMSNPVSSVWIFVKVNSLPSTFSQSQWYLL